MDDLRAMLLREVEIAIGMEPAPEHAMTFKEILQSVDVTENKLRSWLQSEIAAGRWKKARRGMPWYYWKVDET